jgi:hypothetical protein
LVEGKVSHKANKANRTENIKKAIEGKSFMRDLLRFHHN